MTRHSTESGRRENVRQGKGGNDIIICVEDSLGWQNALIDEASVQFRLTTKKGVSIRVHPFCRLEMLMMKCIANSYTM